MIEKIVIDYLDANVAPCYAERPQKEPSKPYLVIEKTGSTLVNYIETATIAVQSYAQSMAQAAALNKEVKDAMRGITSLPAVSSCKLNTDSNFTSTALKAYRYQAVFVLTYYEEETNG
jgi:hypothetical protein